MNPSVIRLLSAFSGLGNRFCLTILLVWPLATAPLLASPPPSGAGRDQAPVWGFMGHKLLNRTAVFLLPPEMLPFYKHHIRLITESAVAPDSRRYAVKGEAPRHYIDLDSYGDSALWKMPRRWEQAVELFTLDTLMAHGIVPWHIEQMAFRLTQAFRQRDTQRILKLSAEIGHYIADANVPLHTTANYNGQLTNQYGIHGLWESRLPELFASSYDFFFERRAAYRPSILAMAWEAVEHAHLALDSVFLFEKIVSEQIGPDRKYSFETRNRLTLKVYSKEFSQAYHQMLNGQVERRMRAAVQMIADCWYTCWINAGQPLLSGSDRPDLLWEDWQTEQDSVLQLPALPNIRPHLEQEGGE